MLWDLLALGTPEGEDVERSRGVLRVITWTLVGATVLTLGFEWLLMQRPGVRIALWITLGLLLFAQWLTGRGRLSPARFVVALAVLGVLSFVLYAGQSGIHGVTTMMLPVVIVVGSLVLGRRGFLALTALTVLSAVGLVVADINHVIHTSYHEIATYRDAIAPALFLLLCAFMVRLLAADLTRSLDRARRNERDLAAANRRLEEQAGAIEQSETRWRDYIESASDLVFMLDAGGRFTSVNHAASETFGYAADEIVGRSALEFVAPEDRETTGAALAAVLAGGRVEQLDVKGVARDGRRVVLELRGRSRREDGRVVGTFHIGRDITARRLAEEEKARLQAMRERDEEERRRFEARMQSVQKLESLGVLAGGIAHDFNNLLMAILGNIDLAVDTLAPGSPARESLEAAARSARRAADLTRQMLAYAGRGKLSMQAVALGHLVEEMTEILRVSVSKRAVLRFDFAPDLPSIRADASQIRQVVMSLVTNASEAIGDRGGTITISTGVADYSRAELADNWFNDDLPGGQYVAFGVSDTGCGMDDDTVKRIFDPFFTTKFTGRGLGLAAVLGIARGHKAAIRLHTALGRGTDLQILFPAAPAAAAPADPGGSALYAGSGTVLLVDDEEEVRRPAKAMLERLGFRVLAAADGQQAMALFEANRSAIRCAVLDLTMPVMDGVEALRALRESDPSVRVIISSGYGEQDVTARFVVDRPSAFIQKPYSLQALGETLRSLLAPPRAPETDRDTRSG